MATKPKPQGDQQLASALNLIEGTRASQVGGIQALGGAQDSNISQIYGTLRGGLQQGVAVQQGITQRGMGNVNQAYGLGGNQAAAASAGAMSQITDNAGRLGMDQRALGEVQGKLAMQAGLFANRNQQSAREKVATIAQQGSGMASISRMAVEAASHAEAQGKKDLSNRIMTEVAKANTSAAQQKVGATTEAGNRAAKAAAQAQAEASSAMKLLISEQRAAAREASRSQGREKDPLDQAIKMLRIKQMESGMDPDDPRNQMRGLNLERLLEERDARQADAAREPEDAVWEHIRSTVPGGGSRSIPLLEAARATGSSTAARAHIDEKAGNLNKDFLYDMLRRLENSR